MTDATPSSLTPDWVPCPHCRRPARRQLMGTYVCDTCHTNVPIPAPAVTSNERPLLERMREMQDVATKIGAPISMSAANYKEVADHIEKLETGLAAVIEAERRNGHETTDCHIRPHDFCSAGTCKVCIDAARYRIVRVSRLTGDVLAHQLDEACDALLRARNAENGSLPQQENNSGR